MKLRTGILAVSVWVMAGSAFAQGPDVAREGAGERREKLNQAEYKPFDLGFFGALTDWSNGEALTTADLDGNVVLVYSWAHWYSLSTRSMTQVQRLYEKYKDQGLVVVGVHDALKYEGAAEAAKKAGATFRIAKDNGGLTKTLMVDQHPDFYIVDRAGNLRFADIETRSLDSAVEFLVNESRDGAVAAAELKNKPTGSTRPVLQFGQIQTDIDLVDIPNLPIPEPPAVAYERASWPGRNRDFEKDVLQWNQNNFGGQEEQIRTLGLPGGPWFGNEPPTRARATVVYFWDPDQYKSWSPVQQEMERLQLEHPRSLHVIGACMMFRASNQQNQGGPEAQRRLERFERQVEAAKRVNKYTHSILVEPSGSIWDSLQGQQGNQNTTWFPVAAVFSSDNVMRYIGYSLDSRFKGAVEAVLRNDPWVKTRREIEQAYIDGKFKMPTIESPDGEGGAPAGGAP